MASVAQLAAAATPPNLLSPRSGLSFDLPLFERDVGPYAHRTLFVEPGGNAQTQADLWRTTDPDGAAMMDEIAAQPIAMWLGSWLADPAATVDAALDRAGPDLRAFVIYDIPNRDCGSFSAGGAADVAAYQQFVDEVAAGLAGRQAIVILEPDGLALNHCLDEAAEDERHQMFSYAVDTLTAAGGDVYIDAGDSNWISANQMAARLLAAGVERAAGFALNVSHTEFTHDEIAYAEALRDLVGHDAHYVIDTSRNGLGPTADNQWCNPRDRGIGARPTVDLDGSGLDALLWVKLPGGSDGVCNGGPAAGVWWPEYARELVEHAP